MTTLQAVIYSDGHPLKGFSRKLQDQLKERLTVRGAELPPKEAPDGLVCFMLAVSIARDLMVMVRALDPPPSDPWDALWRFVPVVAASRKTELGDAEKDFIQKALDDLVGWRP